ncbi:hypothetical protein EQV77_06800 [Halobacillus fulvus]|nr:hypothetical protein EQV77_06800 [Halobacillus fulvus]
MLKCSWCMKKIVGEDEVFGIPVTFAEGVVYNDPDGRIIQIELTTRRTSVPMILSAVGSEAKNKGEDGIFAVCSEVCGQKMQKSLEQEKKLFKSISTRF